MHYSGILSKLQTFIDPIFEYEQYDTPISIVVDIIDNVVKLDGVDGKVFADLGCGAGVFGIGLLLNGAKKVYFFDVDSKILKVLLDNILVAEKFSGLDFSGKYFIVNKDIKSLSRRDCPGVDIVLQNPPFGSYHKSIDVLFLKKAMIIACTVYSIHLLETKHFIEKTIVHAGFKIDNMWQHSFALKNTMEHHLLNVKNIQVGCWKATRN